MATTNLNWVMHPGFHIKEEMEERGWNQRDLAFILGVPEQAINMILGGKRGISADMAKALGAAFDVNPDLFANLQKDYDMAQAKQPKPGIALLGQLHVNYPVREMVNRGWLVKSDAQLLEQQLVRFFEVKAPSDIPYMDHAAKRSDVTPAQLAWLFRVKQIAKSISAPKYSENALQRAVAEMERFTINPEDTRQVPKLMMEAGVRYILVEKLPNSKIDGVCFWLDNNSPVIGMSTQRDTIDNFWFVLRHEIEHVLRKHGRKADIVDADVLDDSQQNEEEQSANAAACEFCVSNKFDLFMTRKKPFYYERDVLAFSAMIQRHPGIVVGQMQRRMNNYAYLTRYLSKIRQFVLSGAIVDGWGQVAQVAT
jgi:HTH-type transcriptional regulator/antitoxin HigA